MRNPSAATRVASKSWPDEQSQGEKDKMDEIAKRMDELWEHRISELREITRRSYRVVDLRDADKSLLVSMILEAEFGRKKVAAWAGC